MRAVQRGERSFDRATTDIVLESITGLQIRILLAALANITGEGLYQKEAEEMYHVIRQAVGLDWSGMRVARLMLISEDTKADG